MSEQELYRMVDLENWFSKNFDCSMGPAQSYIELKDKQRFGYRTIGCMSIVSRFGELDKTDSEEKAGTRCSQAILSAWKEWIEVQPEFVGSLLYWRMKPVSASERDFATDCVHVKVVLRMTLPAADYKTAWPFQHAEGSYLRRVP